MVSDLHSGTEGMAATETRGALPKGASLRNYEVLSVLGQGAFGITYLARDINLDREVAIKEYLPTALALREEGVTVVARSTNTAPDFVTGRDRFLDEARTLAKLDRAPSVVRVLDFLAANGTAYMVMALAQGETLEARLKRLGKLDSTAIDRLLWPLLDGLEQVHAAGYLHRDIKPANILLDAQGNPTLIDFGASRAALAGSSMAMTAIFTPGYAAPEQFTSAKQGPWTDIYGVSATLYHAIVGHPPPSAFERMLDDGYEPLVRLLPAGFPPGMLVGIDAGLAVRAVDRPQSIAGWRAIISQAAEGDAAATVVLGRRPDPTATMAMPRTATPEPKLLQGKSAKRGAALWGGAVAMLLMLAGGGYYFATSPSSKSTAAPAFLPTAPSTDVNGAQKADEQRKADEVAARQKVDAEARQKAEEQQKAEAEKAEAGRKAAADEALRRQIVEETRRAIEQERAEAAVKQQAAEEEARKKAEAEARRNLDADDVMKATAGESALRLMLLDHQHIQVALTALGFNTNGTSGSFGPHTRQMIASWQKARNDAATGFLTGAQNQALLREAAPAVARFDDEKRIEEAKKKVDEAAKAAPAAAASTPAVPVPAMPNVAAAAPRSGPDGYWRGAMHCTPSKFGGEITIGLQINVSGGSGTWTRPGSGPATNGNHSISLTITGQQVLVTRAFVPNNRPGVLAHATMSARWDGDSITGAGPEANGGGRTCDIHLQRTP